MSLTSMFSVQEMKNSFLKGIKRFTFSYILIVALTVVSFIEVGLSHNQSLISPQVEFFLLFYLISALVLSVSLSIWAEDWDAPAWKRIATKAVVHIVWLGAAFLFSAKYPDYSTPQILQIVACCILILFSMFLLSFLREKTDIPFLKLLYKFILFAVIAGLVCSIFGTGIRFLLAFIEELFNVKTGDSYLYVYAFSYSFLFPVLVLQLIPEKARKHSGNFVIPKFFNAVFHYIFFPLLVAYILVLLVYALKILFAWELPRGQVSYLVAASAVASILFIALIYPNKFQGEENKTVLHRLDYKLFRWLPVAVLPFIFLMTVAICRRLNDYGITLSRLYLLTFNIWCYAAFIILAVTRSKRIWWIPASVAIIFFLSAVGPWSYGNITKAVLTRQLHTMFAKANATLPLNSLEYEELLSKLDYNTAAKIDRKLDYMRDMFKEDSTNDFVGPDVMLGKVEWRRNLYENEEPDAVPAFSVSIGGYGGENYEQRILAIPEGYRYVQFVSPYTTFKCNTDSTSVLFDVSAKSESPKIDRVVSFKVTFEELEAAAARESKDEPYQVVLTSGDAMFHIRHLSLYLYDTGVPDFSVSGILFLK